GALWVGQNASGWAGSSGIQRITFTGKMPVDIQNINITEDGFKLAFTTDMDKSALENPENYSVRSYFYAYHSKYGSDQMDLKDIEIKGVEVSEDGKEVRFGLSP